MTLFEAMQVPRIINGVGPATRFGGVPLHEDVLQAMREATAIPTRMDILQERAGARIADLLGVESSYITSGASAALTLAVAIAIARDDAAVIDQLPNTSRPSNVVIQAAHRDPYDRAVQAAGGTLVSVGYPSSTHPGEIKRVLDDRAVAILYRPGRKGNLVKLDEVATLARESGALVIVDGAIRVPPAELLVEYLEAGADLVALSGGKRFRGPQASGLLCGRRELIRMAAMHHQDMDERPATWRRNTGQLERATPPRHGIGRGMKVGREQIFGLVAAIERYVAEPGRDESPGIDELQQLYATLSASSLQVEWLESSPLGVPEVRIRPQDATAEIVLERLAAQDVPIYVEESEVWCGALIVNPMALVHGDGARLADGMLRAVGA